MSKEAWTALLCVAMACAVVLAGCGKEDGRDGATARERGVFAGETGAGAVHRADPVRPVRRGGTRVRTRRARASATVVVLRRAVALHAAPDGRRIGRVAHRTDFGSRTVLPVLGRRGAWLEVTTTALPNGATGWIRRDPGAFTPRTNAFAIVVDRSERRLTLLRRGRPVVSARAGVGRAGSETPTGRFAVTDRLLGTRYSRTYGCCILALSGRQPHLPPGWRGGNRLAIHGTNGRSAAATSSAGCVALDRAPLERLMLTVPLGTVVTIRP